MEKQAMSLVSLRLRYHGAGPVHWSGGPADFGLQHSSGLLQYGEADADGGLWFDLSLEAKPNRTGAPALAGVLAHGPPAKRFLYLSWRNRTGEFAQRLLVPLGSIGWDEINEAQGAGAPLVGELVDHTPKATSTGANIGGTRLVGWKVGRL